jgi:hypothetical protein
MSVDDALSWPRVARGALIHGVEMLNGTVLDVAVGLIFVFLMISVACSLLNERIHSLLDTRAKMLDQALQKLLGTEQGSPFDGVKDHALIRAVAHQGTGMPSYIPASAFSCALFDTLVPTDGEHPMTYQQLREAICRLPKSSRTALLTLTNSAEGNLAVARANVEHWFDNAMERVSGDYKRHVTVWLFGLGFVLAAGTNADAIRLVQRFEHEGTLRAAVTARADKVDAANHKLALEMSDLDQNQMNLLFWDTEQLSTAESEARCPRALRQPEFSGSWLRWVLFKLMGFVMTALAVSLGAPFWFDLLGRLVNLRATGARPPKAKPASAEPGK